VAHGARERGGEGRTEDTGEEAFLAVGFGGFLDRELFFGEEVLQAEGVLPVEGRGGGGVGACGGGKAGWTGDGAGEMPYGGAGGEGFEHGGRRGSRRRGREVKGECRWKHWNWAGRRQITNSMGIMHAFPTRVASEEAFLLPTSVVSGAGRCRSATNTALLERNGPVFGWHTN